MGFIELFFIAVGLSMDAFAAAICKGLSMPKFSIKKSIIIGLYFGIFQAAMPLAGYILGSKFTDKIMSLDHWAAFILLGIIGGKMIQESFSKDSGGKGKNEASVGIVEMLPLAIATSVDALAVGISFAFLSVDITYAISFIGITTFVLSAAGVAVGNFFGAKYKSKAEFAGGAILILIGIKILLEHTVLM